MKKKLTGFMLAFALAAVPACALADPVITETGISIPGGDWVAGTELLMIGDYTSGYKLASKDGTILGDEVYSSSFHYSHGFVLGQKFTEDLNNRGALSTDGKQIVEFKYGEVKAANPHWLLGYVLKTSDANNYDFESWSGDAYALIDTVDIYHVADGAASLVGTLTRDHFLEYYADGNYITIQDRSDNSCTMYDASFQPVATDLPSVYDNGDIGTADYITFLENGQYGIKDPAGNILLPPSYAYISTILDGYVEVSNGEKQGLIDLSGKVIVPVECDSVSRNYYGPAIPEESSYNAGGYFAAEIDGKLAYYSMDGVRTMEPTYATSALTVNGASAILNAPDGTIHILAADGTDTTVDAAYTDLYPLDYSSGMLYKATDANGDYALVDWHGNVVLPAPAYNLSLSGNGQWLLAGSDYNSSQQYAVAYDVTMDSTDGPAEAETEGTDVPAETEVSDAPAETEAADTPAETGAAESESAAPAEGEDSPASENGADLSAVKSLIDTAITLLKADYEGNKTSIVTLLSSAADMLGGGQASASSVLESALSLLNSDAGDAGSVGTLLETLSSLLG